MVTAKSEEKRLAKATGDFGYVKAEHRTSTNEVIARAEWNEMQMQKRISGVGPLAGRSSHFSLAGSGRLSTATNDADDIEWDKHDPDRPPTEMELADRDAAFDELDRIGALARRRMHLLARADSHAHKPQSPSKEQLIGSARIVATMKQLCAKVGLGLPSDLPAFMQLPADAVMDANQFDLWSHRCKTWLDRQKAIKELALEAGATSVHVEQRDCSQLAPLLLEASTVRKVSICDCYVSNAALLSIAQLLRDRLKSLSIVTSKGFDDVGVKALAAYCAELQELRLICCDVSDDSLMVIFKYCPTLQKLEITDSDQITAKSLNCAPASCKVQLVAHVKGAHVSKYKEIGGREYDPRVEEEIQKRREQARLETERARAEAEIAAKQAQVEHRAEQRQQRRKTRRKRLRMVMDSALVEIFIMCAVIFYSLFIFIDFSIPEEDADPPPPSPPAMPGGSPTTPPPSAADCDQLFQIFYVIDAIFLSFFMLELLVRLYAWGCDYFKDVLNAIDAAVVVGSFSFLVYLGVITGVCEGLSSNFANAATVASLVRLVRLFRLVTVMNKIQRTRKSAQLLRKKATYKRMGSPVEKVLEILSKYKKNTDDKQDRENIDFIMEVIVSDQLYTVSAEMAEEAAKQSGVTAEQAAHFLSQRISLVSAEQEACAEAPDTALCEISSERRRSVTLSDASLEWVDRLMESNEIGQLLSGALTWEFDVFSLDAICSEHTMVLLFMHLIYEFKLDSQLRLNCPRIVRFVSKLQQGYKDVPFHNYVHACDVLQGTAFFLSQHRVKANLGALDTFAMLIAAAMHDHGHPGVSNAFLINIRDPLAITYNDTSVLEMFHISSTWKLLANEELNIFAGFSRDQYHDMRQTLVQAIMATDMKYHFEHLSKFKTRVSSGVLDAPDRNDTRLVLSMCLHAADVSNPLRAWHCYVRWAARVMSEFFRQGDKEMEHALTVSPYMDRATTNIAKCQTGFVNIVLKPFFEAWCGWLGEDVHELLCGNLMANVATWEAEGENALGEELQIIKERS